MTPLEAMPSVLTCLPLVLRGSANACWLEPRRKAADLAGGKHPRKKRQRKKAAARKEQGRKRNSFGRNSLSESEGPREDRGLFIFFGRCVSTATGTVSLLSSDGGGCKPYPEDKTSCTIRLRFYRKVPRRMSVLILTERNDIHGHALIWALGSMGVRCDRWSISDFPDQQRSTIQISHSLSEPK